MGIDDDFLSSYIKSQIACGNILPSKGNVFISIEAAQYANPKILSRQFLKAWIKSSLLVTSATS